MMTHSDSLLIRQGDGVDGWHKPKDTPLDLVLPGIWLRVSWAFGRVEGAQYGRHCMIWSGEMDDEYDTTR